MKENNKIKSLLQSHESPIDIAGQWLLLEERLEKKKKRRFMLLLFPLVLGIASLYLFISNNISNNVVKNNIVTDTSINSNVTDQNSSIAKIAESKTFLTTGKSNVDSKTGISQKSIFDKSSNKNINYKKQSIKIKNPIIKKSNLSIVDNGLRLKSNIPQNTEIVFIESLPITESKFPEKSDTKMVKIEVNKMKNDVIDQRTLFEIDQLQERTIPLSYNPTFLMKHRVTGTKNSKAWIEFDAGIGMSNAAFKNNSTETNELVAVQKSTTKSLENWQTQIMIGKNIFDNVYIKSGINFTQTNEKVSNSFLDTTTTILNGQVIEIYKNYLGETIQSKGDLAQINILSHDTKLYNESRYLSLSIMLGRRFYIGHSRFSIEGGILYPIVQSHIGNSFLTNNILIANNILYKNSNKIRPLLALNYELPLSKNIALKSAYKYTNQKLSTNFNYTKVIDQHSLSLGIIYFIN